MIIEIDWEQNEKNILINRMLALKPFTKMVLRDSQILHTVFPDFFPVIFRECDIFQDICTEFYISIKLFEHSLSIVIDHISHTTLEIPVVMFV